MRIKKPDKKNALSLLDAAKKKMEFTLSLELNDASKETIASNIDECFRMLGDAMFVEMGIQQTDHKEVIGELVALNVETKRPLQSISNLRFLRHNINYYGYEPKMNEVEDAIDIAQQCFTPLYKEIYRKILHK
ncbi:MAG: hypothetical protein ACMXYC_00495 [Candidatus Woesearchaeota archaeon]